MSGNRAGRIVGGTRRELLAGACPGEGIRQEEKVE